MESSKSEMVAIVNSFTEDELRQILDMERELFPETLRDDNYEKEMGEGKFAVIAYCPEEKIAGYIFVVPHDEAHAKLSEADPLMPKTPGALYIESIAVRSDMQGRGYFSKLMKKLLGETKEQTITMHARVQNNSSVGMKKYGAVHLHSVENWFNSGERFDYLVIRR